MKVVSFISLFVALSSAAFATIIESTENDLWPNAIKVGSSVRKSMTNQERMKRGLGPAKPKRLYKSDKRADALEGLAKRLDPHPSSKVVGSNTYVFEACYDTYTSANGNLLVANGGTTDDAVQACANYAYTQDIDYNIMVKPEGASYRCYYGTTVTSGQRAASCTVANFARYLPEGV